MLSNPSYSIIVIIVIGSYLEIVMLFIKEGLCSDKFGGDGTNPSDCVLLWV